MRGQTEGVAMRIFSLMVGTVMATGAVIIGLKLGADPVEGIKLAARYTARASFLLFLPVFLASALYRLFPGHYTKAMYQNRRRLGLSFALAHTVHLAAFVAYFLAIKQPVPLLGAPVYVVLYAMVLTSNDAARRAMGANWKRLHKAGIYVLWAAFTLAYTGKAVSGEEIIFTAPLALTCYIAIGLRYLAWRRKQAKLLAAAYSQTH